MFKSKIVYALSLSFLLNASHLPLVYAGGTEEDDNQRPLKAQKVVVKKTAQSKSEQKKRKLRKATEKLVTKVKARKADFPEPNQRWGAGSANVWEAIGSHLSLDDFFRLFSVNKDFLALGERLIQKRPLSKHATLDLPFTLQGQFKGRKFSISHLMRKDLANGDFIDLRDCLEDPDDAMLSSEERKMVRKATYYAPVHPLMAAYFDLQVRRGSTLYTRSDFETAKAKFIGTVRDHARAWDPLALEMITYSRILSGIFNNHNLFFQVFPSQDYPNLERKFTHRLFEQSSNPEYLVNVCRFVADVESRTDDNERSNCSIWKSVGIPLLHYPDQGRRFSSDFRVVAENVYVQLPCFRTRESAFIYFNTDPLFKAQHALLRYLVNDSSNDFCPSMRVLESLVLSTKFNIGEKNEVFHPDFIEETEGYLHRLLSFGERGNEFNKYTEEKYWYLFDVAATQAANDADPSVVRIDAIKKYAHENLLALYLQKGEQDKAKQIAKDMTKDRTGDSYFAAGSIFDSHGSERLAIRYYREAVLQGEDVALAPLWRCVTKVMNADEKMRAKVNQLTSKRDRLIALASIYITNKKYDDCLIYLKYGCQFDNSGYCENIAAKVYNYLGNEEGFNRFIGAAAAKGDKVALSVVKEANERKMSYFEYQKFFEEEKKAERK